jgi:DNA-binding NarL/FixJ family response regulator
VDGIVLDLDTFYEAGTRQAVISGFRLLELLWRAVSTRPTALVVLTALDYAEMDNVLRSRVSALLVRSLPVAQLVARLEAALGRVALRRQLGMTMQAASPLPAAFAE